VSQLPTLALTIRQPWVSFIFDLPADLRKDIENRRWHTGVRGRIWIHAAKGMTRAEYDSARAFAIEHVGVPAIEIAPAGELMRGVIVGSVELVDCVDEAEYSPDWFAGPFGFVLARPRKLARPVPCSGALGFWRVSAPVFSQLRELEAAT
jgi:hypothetical protein